MALTHWGLATLIAPNLSRYGNLVKNTSAMMAPQMLVFDDTDAPARWDAVSLCMIIKNEADNLAACLESVGDFASEIIIVDTGSTDRTVEIATALGAKIHHFDWIDDFAAARNEALKYATGDWIFWLDADDRVPPASLVKLKTAVASGSADAYRCRMVSLLNGDDPAVNSVYYTLLFRNHRGVQFEGPVHETPTDAILRQGLTLANTNIIIEHHGYSGDPVQLRRKAERNARILRRCLAAEPNHLKWRYHLGVSLYQLADYQGAIEQFKPVIDHPTPPLNEQNQVYRAHLLLISAYDSTGNLAQADNTLRRALARFPRRRHLWVTAGMYHLYRNDPVAAVEALEHARALPLQSDIEGERWQSGVLEKHLAGAYHARGLVTWKQQDYVTAAESFQREIELVSLPVQQAAAWKLLALCLQKLGQDEGALVAWKMAKELAVP